MTSNLSPLPQYFQYISNQRSQITRSFVKFGCSIGIFLSFARLICRSTNISKCFRGSLRLRDNEGRLYSKLIILQNLPKEYFPLSTEDEWLT